MGVFVGSGDYYCLCSGELEWTGGQRSMAYTDNQRKRAVITGITGQDGAYLARLLLEQGYRVYGLLRRESQGHLHGLEYLGIRDKVEFVFCDLMRYQEVVSLTERLAPTEIYNLAAQSSVGRSFAEPDETLSFNVQSVLNLLEAIRNVDPAIRFFQASSSEMFGKVEHLPITKSTPLNPQSPYAASKAAAHILVGNYRDIYQLFAVAGILFNHESYLRSPDFFVKKVIHDSILIKQGKKETLQVGNIEVRRDFGYAPKYVEAMWRMLQADRPGDYLICSGRSVLLKDIILHVFRKLSIPERKLVVAQEFYRPNEIEDMYGDNSITKAELQWDYEDSFYDVLDVLIQEELCAQSVL